MPENDRQTMPPETGRRGGREETKKLKRIILCCMAVMLLFVVLYYSVPLLIGMIESKTEEHKRGGETKGQTIIFYTPDYNEDIYDDEYYMGLDRSIYYRELDTGVTVAVGPDDYDKYDDGVRFMVDFVNYIIAGDAESYNSCFDKAYFLVEGQEKKEAFTMQKLYNIVITKMSKDNNGGYLYTLEYMIKNNNGTLRADVGSDASRKQYVNLSEKNGELLIEKIEYAAFR